MARGHEGMDPSRVGGGGSRPSVIHGQEGMRLVAEEGGRVAGVCPPHSETSGTLVGDHESPMLVCGGDWQATSAAWKRTAWRVGPLCGRSRPGWPHPRCTAWGRGGTLHCTNRRERPRRWGGRGLAQDLASASASPRCAANVAPMTRRRGEGQRSKVWQISST